MDDETTEPTFLVQEESVICKPGVRTTEFWVTIVVVAAASVLLGLDKIDQSAWLTAAGLSSGSYAVSRGLAKL